MSLWLQLLTVWLICGPLNYWLIMKGVSEYYENSCFYETREDCAVVAAILGPFATIVLLLGIYARLLVDGFASYCGWIGKLFGNDK